MRFFDYITSIEQFAKQIGISIDPLPKVVLDKSEHAPFDVLIETAQYNFKDMTITLCIDKRHPKDILRSFCHELIHHSQYLTDRELYLKACYQQTGHIADNEDVEKIESDAYERGNLLMRKWTEDFKDRQANAN